MFLAEQLAEESRARVEEYTNAFERLINPNVATMKAIFTEWRNRSSWVKSLEGSHFQVLCAIADEHFEASALTRACNTWRNQVKGKLSKIS